MLERVETAGVVFYRSPLLHAAGVAHAFSTRVGGVSRGPFASLNLGNPSGTAERDDEQNIEANYRLLVSAARLPAGARCSVHQVHGCGVVELKAGQSFESGQKADALISDDPTRVIAVRTADCVPVLIASEQGNWVVAIHAGWRGVIAGVVPAAVARLRSLSSVRLLAAIGPSIGFEAFEVGPEVLAEFERVFGCDAPTQHDAGKKGCVDLRASIRLQLRKLDLSDSQIDITDRCTVRDAAEFYSHRRDHGVTGRMMSLIAPRPR